MQKSKNGRNPFIYILIFIAFTFLFVSAAVVISLLSSILQHNENEPVFSYDQKPITVIIDAGHGGEDGGAVSPQGYCEKDINLDIAVKLRDFLLSSDHNVVMIREDDRLMYEHGQESRKKYHDITNRIKIASSYEDAILVSIHQNKFPIRKYSGFQVYFSKNNENSEKLAKVVQDNIIEYLQPDNKRDIKRADKTIRLLDDVKIPAVLAECGFLSNEQEAELLNSSEYRSKIAYLIYVSIIQYLSENKEN